jgi:hypothetical protein
MVPCWIVGFVNQVLMTIYRKPGVSMFPFFPFQPYLLTEPGLRARRRFFASAAVFVGFPLLVLFVSKFFFSHAR